MKEWTDIYREWMPVALQMATAFTRDTQGAEDLVHDLFLNLLEKQPDIARIDCLRSYFFKAIKNRYLNHQRKHANQLAFSLDRLEHFAVPEINIDQSLDIASGLSHALKVLPRRQQQALRLKIEGVKSGELALILGIKTRTAKSLANDTRLACIKHIGYLREGSAA